jgi:ABC-type dipeptide/oligopeptide/nickel transport system ATPase component
MSIILQNEPQSLLAVNNLSLQSTRFDNREDIISDISLNIDTGNSVGLVGESGSGKSMTALAILDLLPEGIDKVGGSIYFQGKAVTKNQMPTFESLRGKEIAIIFQDAAAALNPVFQVGRQIKDIIRRHFPVGYRESKERVMDLLHKVGFAEPHKIYRRYPHELSGGMAQRIMIAMALSCQPKLIIADEPTTALDVKTQLQIIRLIKTFQIKYNFGLMLITHDIHLIANAVSEIFVLHRGEIVESGLMSRIKQDPQHNYTKLLFSMGLQWSEKDKYPSIVEQH